MENEGWMEIKKVTALIGNQGSGKSTVAKLVSSFSWMEKALVRGDFDIKWLTRKNKLKNNILKYHRLDHYLKSNGSDETSIEYKGDAYKIKYEKDTLQVEETNTGNYEMPQIMYVPAERNFISYVRTPKELKLSSESLLEFLTEFENAKDGMKGLLRLPVNNADMEYDKLNDNLNLKGDGYRIRLTDASSGFQSLVPLYMVSQHLGVSIKKQTNNEDGTQMTAEEIKRFKESVKDIMNSPMTEEQKKLALSTLSSRFKKTAFINIVEEPEQNLFPSSQWKMLQSLLAINNLNVGNQLIVTTHSPYIVSFLSIAMQGNELLDPISKSPKRQEAISKMQEIIDFAALTPAEEVIVYQLDETNGRISRLPMPYGIPSDNNYLNNILAEANHLLDRLLEIEETL
jgi:predicted ATPase